MSLNIHLRFHEPLLNEGTGFRYHLLLENTSTQTLFLDPVTHLPFKITELEEKKPLLPQIDYWIEPLFPEHLLPKSTFRAEGELLTHFLFKPHHHYEVTLALKGFFPKGKKKKQVFCSPPLPFTVPLLVDPLWHKALEKEAIQALWESAGYALEEILPLPLDCFFAYTFQVVPVVLSNDQILLLRLQDQWRNDSLIKTFKERYPYCENYHYLPLLVEPLLLYRLIYSFYVFHQISPHPSEGELYLPEEW